ncbi:MAG: RrF2 family transcriptional regulator [Planctomycetota bacterium]|jgi:Rrf2 family protein
MRISTKGRYGVRAMLELALHYGDGPILMSDIAKRQELSRKYLHSLLTPLKAAGFVSSVRGAGGGFLLAKDPAKIRVIDILKVLEGSLAPVHCVENKKSCHRAKRCAARHIWQEVADAVEKVLTNVTLKDMVAMEKGKKRKP